ncbi:hypothetical protein CesoFtcFv8_001466 [Champsocephalus esox]|uniref:Uncharacterized protein n=1 Tax=Champsocephalus esox TaxID=159716 RepID=A0AAN8D8A6_9TELE|nr:hypothetical protein CesoFtcFv8_001466 [Champsocephalus esox]
MFRRTQKKNCEDEEMLEKVADLQYDRRTKQADGTFKRVRAGNENKKGGEDVKDMHVRPPAVCVSQQQQQWVQTEDDGTSAKRPGGVPQPLTLPERNPAPQEVDREKKGVWDISESLSLTEA